MFCWMTLITMPSDSMSCSRNAWCVVAERLERRELDDGHHLALEQRRQHEDVVRRGLAEARRDADVVVGRLGEQDRASSRARPGRRAPRRAGSGSRRVLRSLVRVARDEPAARPRRPRRLARKNAPWCAPTSGVSSRHDHAADGLEVALALHHPGEAREVRVQPVLLRVPTRRLREVADHLVDVVLELARPRPSPRRRSMRVRSPCVTAVETSAIART